jgi:hypothetical protein
MTRALQHWRDGKPIVTIVEKDGELPDVDDLNSEIPESEWELGKFGKLRAPWQLNYVIYLLNVETGELYTYINDTMGASIAYNRLREKFDLMQRLRSPNVLPQVRLDSKPMKLKSGALKLRPEFTPLKWHELNAGAAGIEQKPAAQQIEDRSEKPVEKIGKPVRPVSPQEDLDDEIPFS